MKFKLSLQEQRALLILVLIVAVVVWIYPCYVIVPLIRAVVSGGNEVSSAQNQLTMLENSTSRELTLRAQYLQVNKSVMSLRSQLPSEEELSAMIESLSDLANQANVRIQTIVPQRSDDQTNTADIGKGDGAPSVVVYREIPIQIDALAGYHQLGTFLALIESQDKPIQVSSLHIAENHKEAKRHLIKLVLRSYFAVKETAPRSASPVAQTPVP